MLTDTLLGSCYAASAVSALPNNELYGSVMTSLVISGSVAGFILGVSVTGAIVARLWWMGRTIALLTTTSTNRFASSIYVVVESGAIALVAGAFLFALFASKSPGTLAGFDVDSQLIVRAHLSPLLLRTLSRFDSAGIDATLDPRASSSWPNQSLSYSKRSHDDHRTG